MISSYFRIESASWSSLWLQVDIYFLVAPPTMFHLPLILYQTVHYIVLTLLVTYATCTLKHKHTLQCIITRKKKEVALYTMGVRTSIFIGIYFPSSPISIMVYTAIQYTQRYSGHQD